MPELTPHIVRVRTDRSLRYPLHYSDLEACFARFAGQPMTLDVHFAPWHTNPDTPAPERPGDGEHPLLKIGYDPEALPAHYVPDTPGAEAERVAAIHVYAVPGAALTEAGLDRKQLREIVEGGLGSLCGSRLSELRWQMFLRLCANEREVECRSRRWTGLRPEDETRVRVPLHADHRP